MSNQREWTRRDFLALFAKGTGIAMGASLFSIPGFNKVFAATVEEIPVVWLQGGCCSGCSVSLLNTKSPSIQELLLGEVVPGKHVNLLWHPNISAGQGHQFMDIIDQVKKRPAGSYLLVIEGTMQTKDDGIFCVVGERDGKPVTLLQHVLDLAPNAMAIVAFGTCAAFGGIPAAPPNPTDSKPVTAVLDEHGIKTPVVNISGCPPHPDWFVGTLATVLIGGLGMLDLDEHRRPKAFYGSLIHDNCPRRGMFDAGLFAKDFGDKGCLYKLGCKGPVTHSDCPIRKWNGGVNWIIGSGHPCMGCVEPTFPYGMDVYQVVPVNGATPPSTYPGIVTEKPSAVSPLATGIVGAVAGLGLAAAAGAMRKKPVEDREEA
jgi:hydrogenase small subunit